MTGGDLIKTLKSLIEEHGDLPVFNEDGSPLHDFHYVKEEDSEEMVSSVHLHTDKTRSESPINASSLIAAYESARDSSASNEWDEWDDLYVTDAVDNDHEDPVYKAAGDDHPEGFYFEPRLD